MKNVFGVLQAYSIVFESKACSLGGLERKKHRKNMKADLLRFGADMAEIRQFGRSKVKFDCR